MAYYRFTRLQQYINGQPTDTYAKGERADNVDYSTYKTCMGGSGNSRWVSIPQTVCYNGDLWSMEKEQISYDGGVTWVDTTNTRRVAVVEPSASQCSGADNDWRVVYGEYICNGTTKCLKEAEYIDNSPTGRTRAGSMVELLSEDCGVMYQWVDVPGEYVCVFKCGRGDKYTKQKQQYSLDNGVHWEDTGETREGDFVEKNSSYCGCDTSIPRWITVSGEYVCVGTSKYTKEKEQTSTDGTNWTDTGNTRAGSLIEANSTDCGYVPPSTTRWIEDTGYVCVGTDKYNKEKEQISYDSGSTWTDTGNTKAGSTLIEANSADCSTETDYGDYTITKNMNPDVIGTSCTPPSWYTGETDDTHEYYPGGNTSTGAGEYANVIEEKTVFNGNGETVWTYWYLYWRITGKWVGGPYDEKKAIYYNGENGCLNGTYYDYSRYSGRVSRNMKIKPTPNIMKDFMKVNGKLFSLNFRCSTEDNIEDSYLYIYDIAGDKLFKLKDLHDCKTVKTLTVDGTVVTITLTNSKHNTLTVKVDMTDMSLISSNFYEKTRWVADTGYMCAGTDKKNKEKEQGSNDGGTTWTDTGETRAGSTLIEANSFDCGYVAHRWVADTGYKCVGYNKYNKEKEQQTTDGINWTDTGITRAGSTLIESDSTDCGYEPTHDYSTEYLTTLALGDGNISLKKEGSNSSKEPITNIEYSKNNGAWTSYTYGTDISVVKGDNIRWKATIKDGNSNYTKHDYYSRIYSTVDYKAYGNPLSLLKNDSFVDEPGAIYEYAYYRLFSGNKLKDISGLALPATRLANHCYDGMFYGCPLTSVPSNLLPATTLSDYCYLDMFYNCTDLTSVPSNLLPATTLARGCYRSMFYYCLHLTTAPELPSTMLVEDCYQSMFHDCSALTRAPELPATTILSSCYASMFYDCVSLNYIKCLATDISAYDSTVYWTEGVSRSGTFVKNAAMSNWSRGTSGIPSRWTVQDV